jgi:DNA-binding transcriptional LysR family regulator
MDLKQIEYIVEIANEQNISRAAQKLFITQSALTQQLIKLERELNTQLFYRSKNNCQLTPAGKIYIDNAREMLRIKQNTYRAITDITHIHKGSLSIGFVPGRGVAMFAHIYPTFHKLYPDISISPRECLTKYQLDLLKEGNIDIGFISIPEDYAHTGIQLTQLAEEDLYLVVPASHPFADDLRDPVDIRLFRHTPFVIINKESTMRPLVDDIFKNAGFMPKVLFETPHNPTILTMVENGICCGIMTGYYLRGSHPAIKTFRIANVPKWHTYACYRPNNYLSEPFVTFINMAKDYFA